MQGSLLSGVHNVKLLNPANNTKEVGNVFWRTQFKNEALRLGKVKNLPEIILGECQNLLWTP